MLRHAGRGYYPPSDGGSSRNIPLFEGVAEAELRALAERTVTRSYPKQAILINEGDESDSLYLILAGRVKVYLSDESGKELILAIKGPGQYFGEMVLDSQPRSASVMTLEPSAVRGAVARRLRGSCCAMPRSRCR